MKIVHRVELETPELEKLAEIINKVIEISASTAYTEVEKETALNAIREQAGLMNSNLASMAFTLGYNAGRGNANEKDLEMYS
jgi:hypothetical protein